MAYGMSGRVFHAPFISTHPGFELSAVVERHEKKAASRYPGIVSYNSIEELLDDAGIELVIINTPTTPISTWLNRHWKPGSMYW